MSEWQSTDPDGETAVPAEEACSPPRTWDHQPCPDSVADLGFLIFYLKTRNGVYVRVVDLLIFLPFLVLVLLTLFQDDVTTAHHHVELLSEVLNGQWNTGPHNASANRSPEAPGRYLEQSFSDISTPRDIWAWLQADQGPADAIGAPLQTIAGQNHLLGMVRLSQRRVRADSHTELWSADWPELHGNYTGWVTPSPAWSGSAASTAAMRDDAPCGRDPLGRSGFTFSKVVTEEHDQLRAAREGAAAPGSIPATVRTVLAEYPHDGYVFDVPGTWTRERYFDLVRCLERSNWIDPQTRLVSLELYTYDPASDLFVQARMLVELTVAGAVLPVRHMYAFKGQYYESLAAVLETALNLYVAGYVVKLALEIARHVRRSGRAFLWAFSVWRLLEIFNLSVFVYAFYWKLHFWRMGRHELQDGARSGVELAVHWNQLFARLVAYVYRMQTLTQLTALNGMLTCVKVFKFFTVHPSLGLLTDALKSVANHLICLGLYCATITTAYAFSGVVIFGFHSDDYRVFTNAYRSLLRALLGDFDLGELERISEVGADVWFVTYAVAMWLVILNMVIAIIEGGYEAAMEHQMQLQGPLDVAPILREAWSDVERVVVRLLRRKRRRAVAPVEVEGPIRCNAICGVGLREVEDALRRLQDDAELWSERHGGAERPAQGPLWCSRSAIQAQLTAHCEADEGAAELAARALCWLVSDGAAGGADNRLQDQTYSALVKYQRQVALLSQDHRTAYLEEHPLPGSGESGGSGSEAPAAPDAAIHASAAADGAAAAAGGSMEEATSMASSETAERGASAAGSGGGPPAPSEEQLRRLRELLRRREGLIRAAAARRKTVVGAAAAVAAEGWRDGAMERAPSRKG